MYQALYRKYRPRTFDDVVGQEKITETLKTQVETGRLSHAYLFVGTRGTGKTTCAKILARAVNCEHPVNGNPCNQCKSCLGIEDGSIMDVLELDAASNNGVDNVRALRDEAVYSPAIVKKRVYIIDEVHMLSTSAFNALLKILEEPPEHLMFILATTELNKVPATILSRCQRYRFRRIDTDTIADRLRYVAREEQMQLESDAADLLAALADGAMRDGLSLLDQCSGEQPVSVDSVERTIGLADKKSTAELLKAITAGDTARALEIFENFWREGKSPAALMTELCALLRDILMLKVAPQGGRELLSAGFDKTTIDSFSQTLTAEEILSSVDSISARLGALRDGRDPKIACEMCIVSLCDPKLSDDLSSLQVRMSKLESAISIGAISAQMPAITKDTSGIRPASAETPAITTVSQPQDAPTSDLREPEPLSKQDNNISNNDMPPIHEESDAPPMQTEPPAPPIAPTDGDFADKLLAELKKNLSPAHMSHFSNAIILFDGKSVTIEASSSFRKNQLESADLQAELREAITSVLGSSHPFKITDAPATSAPAGEDKLDALLKFGNVKCE